MWRGSRLRFSVELSKKRKQSQVKRSGVVPTREQKHNGEKTPQHSESYLGVLDGDDDTGGQHELLPGLSNVKDVDAILRETVNKKQSTAASQEHEVRGANAQNARQNIKIKTKGHAAGYTCQGCFNISPLLQTPPVPPPMGIENRPRSAC